MKRIIISTILGLVFGFVCFGFASSGEELPMAVGIQIIISRMLIGLTIGISLLNIHWALHGILIGLIYSMPLAFSGLMAPETPEFSKTAIFVSTVVMGIIYGFLIELLTSVVFKAKK